jgi:hypothetical protein
MVIALQQSDPPASAILLFPAWPKEWNVDFKLHAPDRTTVQSRMVDGEVVLLDEQSESRRQHVEIREPFVFESDGADMALCRCLARGARSAQIVNFQIHIVSDFQIHIG